MTEKSNLERERVQKFKPSGLLGGRYQWAGRRANSGEEEISWGNKNCKRTGFVRRENGTKDPS